ncbi:MAG: 2OG-Fe(II) oxygenase [Rhizomicrobium sp.]
MWDAFRQAVIPPADTREWNRTYQLMDGEDVVNSKFGVRKPALRDGTPGASPGPSAMRVFGEKLSALVIGDRAPLSIAPWTGFSASAWIYRAGAGLEWHADTGRPAAYIYYVHPAWRASWGGELLVAADAPSSSGVADAAPSRSDDSRSAIEAVCTTGGAFIYPRPNRLVLLRGGTLHCVKKVERAAGEAFRASVSGFFFDTGTPESPAR